MRLSYVGDTELRTARLVLRRFTDDDRPAFAEMHADPVVMATIGDPMTRAQNDAFLDRIEAGWTLHGFGLWCVDLDGECLGFTGFSAPWFRDGVEIGWRLGSGHWGRGDATEAALAVLEAAFGQFGLGEVISFTAATNERSQRVMERIGLLCDPGGDFEHPSLPIGHPLRPHVLYRLDAAGYRARS